MNKRTLGCAAGLVMIAASICLAEEYYFCVSEGDYGTASNWKLLPDCSGSASTAVPGEEDEITIVAGKTCIVDNTDDTADHLIIQAVGSTLGVVKIMGTGILTLHGDNYDNEHIIDGQLNLEEAGAELAFVRVDSIFSGDGKLVGKADTALVNIVYNGIELTNKIVMEGNFKIDGAGEFVNGDGGVVNANVAGGTIQIASDINLDASTALWMTSGTAGANDTPRLWFNEGELPGSTTAQCLGGDIQITVGKLEVDHPGIQCGGTLIWTAGKIDCIGAKASFNNPCP